MNATVQEIKGLMQPVSIPVMAQEKFCELTGIAPGVLKGWIDKAYIPTILIGKHRLINVAKMTAVLLARGEL